MSSRPSRGPRPSYVQKLVFSDDEGAVVPSRSDSEEDEEAQLDDDEEPSTSTSRRKSTSTTTTRATRSSPTKKKVPPAPKGRGRPPKDPSAPPRKKKVVVDSDEEMEDPQEEQDDESGSAFGSDDAAAAAEEEGEVEEEDDEESEYEARGGGVQAQKKGGGPSGARGGSDDDELSDVVGSEDDESDPRPPRKGQGVGAGSKKLGGSNSNQKKQRQQPKKRIYLSSKCPDPPQIVNITTTSLPILPVPPNATSRKKKSGMSAAVASKSTLVTALNSEALPPLFPHFTSCLLERPAFGKASVVGELKLLGGERMDGGTEMSEGGLAERVRVLHELAPGMVGWEAWSGGIGEGGEGWRPRDTLAKDVEEDGRVLWEGVGPPEPVKLLSWEEAAPYLPVHYTSPEKDVFTGLTDGEEDGEVSQSKQSIPVYTAVSLRSLDIPKPGMLINAGGPVRDVAWCPMTEAESSKRNFTLYLAISAHTSLSSPLPIGHAKPSSTPGSIQIWSIAPTKLHPRSRLSSSKSSKAKGKGKARATDVDMDEDEKTNNPDSDQEEELPQWKRSRKRDYGYESDATKQKFKEKQKERREEKQRVKKKLKEKLKEEGLEDEEDWESRMKLEMVICVEGGMSWELKWCPVGGADPLDEETHENRVPRIGILAGTFEDGSVQVFAVPDPQMLRWQRAIGEEEVSMKPLATMDLDDGMLWTFDWGSGRMLATGSTAGVIAVWDVREAVEKSDRRPLPIHHISDHTGPVRSLSYLRHPQADAHGNVHLDWEQSLIVSVSSNGKILLTDLRDAAGSAGGGGSSCVLTISRGVGLASTAAAVTDGSLYFGEVDSDATKMRIRASNIVTQAKIASHSGQVWDLSHSDFHPTLASASADGSLTATGTMRGTTKRKSHWIHLMEQIYKVDYNEETQEVRLIDNILPQNVTSNGSVANILPKKIGLTSKADLVNAVRPTHPSWSPEVAVLCTEWNSSCGLGRAGMLASGMACGFARVDMLEGRWRGGKLPPAALKDLRLGLKD
ncbi:WD40-repeat-containing domain protein [Mrakia frigida]|uniref:WD40-repeat-containing domain protein n=1 Tax=Mrakia frigida TaxID=29902 RepID=UPI003FCBF51C